MYSSYKLNKQGDNIQPWHNPFSIWNQSVVPCPVLTVASWPAYRFLRRQVRWSGIPISFKIFQFFVTHTVKGFGIVNEPEVDVFLELSHFFKDPIDVANLISSSSAFSKSSLNIWKFMIHIQLKSRLKDFKNYPASMWNEGNCEEFEYSLILCLFVIGMKTDLFQSCGHRWVFQICWHIEYNTFTASSFRIWTTGIPSPPLALFVVILPKAHLTSHSRMSGSRWVITPLWLSGPWRSFFVQFFCVFFCHLFLISSASVRSIPFLSFIVPIFVWTVFLVSLFFLKRSLVFPILLFSFISLHWSLRKAFLSLLAILWNSSFKKVYLSFSPLPLASLLFSAICKASSDNHFALLHFLFLVWFWSLPPVQCYEPPSIVLQALCLSDLIPWIYLSLPLYNHKGFDIGHPWMA